MAAQTKPDSLDEVWASAGTIVDPGVDKVELGWEAEIPPYQYFNYIMNKYSEMLQHVNQYGVPEWDSLTEYQPGAWVLHSAIMYVLDSESTSTGEEPGVSGDWVVLLLDSTSSTSITQAATPNSVKTVQDTVDVNTDSIATLDAEAAKVDENNEFTAENRFSGQSDAYDFGLKSELNSFSCELKSIYAPTSATQDDIYTTIGGYMSVNSFVKVIGKWNNGSGYEIALEGFKKRDGSSNIIDMYGYDPGEIPGTDTPKLITSFTSGSSSTNTYLFYCVFLGTPRLVV